MTHKKGCYDSLDQARQLCYNSSIIPQKCPDLCNIRIGVVMETLIGINEYNRLKDTYVRT